MLRLQRSQVTRTSPPASMARPNGSLGSRWKAAMRLRAAAAHGTRRGSRAHEHGALPVQECPASTHDCPNRLASWVLTFCAGSVYPIRPSVVRHCRTTDSLQCVVPSAFAGQIGSDRRPSCRRKPVPRPLLHIRAAATQRAASEVPTRTSATPHQTNLGVCLFPGSSLIRRSRAVSRFCIMSTGSPPE